MNSILIVLNERNEETMRRSLLIGACGVPMLPRKGDFVRLGEVVVVVTSVTWDVHAEEVLVFGEVVK